MISDLIKNPTSENCPCCGKILYYNHHYYLTGRDLRGETYGEWFEYLSMITKLSHATIYNMHKEFRFNQVKTNENISIDQEHAINESFEEALFKHTKFKKK